MTVLDPPRLLANLELRLPLLRAASPIARSVVSDFLKHAQLTQRRRGDVLRAVMEAVNDYIDRALCAGATFRLSSDATEAEITVEVHGSEDGGAHHEPIRLNFPATL